MLYQFLIIDIDVGVDTTMVEVMVVDVVAIILGIVIAMIRPQNKKNGPNNQKLNYSERSTGKVTRPHSKQAYETDCYRCEIKGHWSHTCRTTKHLVDLYQASVKGKGKQIETNFIGGQDIMDCDANFIDGDDAVLLTHFGVSDFFEDPSGKINHWIGNGNV